MAIGKNPSPRRREVRRNVGRATPASVLEHIDRRQVAFAAAFILAITIFGGLLEIVGQRPSYRAGQSLDKPVFARVAFSYEDKETLEQARENAEKSTPNVYRANEAFLERLRTQFSELIALGKYSSLDEIKEDEIDRWTLNNDRLRDLQSFYPENATRPSGEWEKLVRPFIRKVFNQAILDPKLADTEAKNRGEIAIIHPDPIDPGQPEARRFRDSILNLQREDHQKTLTDRIRQETHDFPRNLQPVIEQMTLAIIEPNYRLDEEESARRKAEASEKAQAPLIPMKENTLLADAGPLESDEVVKLKEEQKAYWEQYGSSNVAVRRLGQFGFMALIGAGLFAYIFFYNEKVRRNPMRGLAITALLLLCQAIAVFGTQMAPGLIFATATFPTLLAATVLSIAYNQRFALAVGAIHALMVMFSLHLAPGFVIVMLTGLAVAISQLNEVRTRSKLVQVGAWTGLVMAFVTVLAAFSDLPVLKDGIWSQMGTIATDALVAMLSGFAVGMVVQGILPLLERVFKVTTSMTLKELNDASHPLLQKLAQSAPGTYQHSLRLADITESAADAIGASGLLCRVGAMYHDIGKINKPAYFIENQSGGPNRHSKLSPAMSVLIIVGHVKDGIEMAREYALPQVLRHFIESHHGTTLVEYFYHAAQKKSQAEDAPAPTEFEFRYPGPKPQSKEAAILMLGDGVESACRSLDEPTPARIEQLVHKIAQKRLMDGQYDECNLTLQELHQIETSMTKTLCAVYHGRVKYPDGKPKGEKEETTTAAREKATAAG